MDETLFLKKVEEYYSDKLLENGPNHKAVDWKDVASQELRFAVLAESINAREESFSFLDYGCGYGAMLPFLKKKFQTISFTGFDISQKMIHEATKLHTQDTCACFTSDRSSLGTYDYVMASGIFNVRLNAPDSEWLEYILSTLTWMHEHCAKGFSFNVLTSYSDEEYKRGYLYYADPRFLFDFCKKNFSRYVSLDHSYPLYEFTIHVKKDDR